MPKLIFGEYLGCLNTYFSNCSSVKSQEGQASTCFQVDLKFRTFLLLLYNWLWT